MNAYNEEGLREGPWEEYYSNGNLWYKENYVNGKANGLFERYFSNLNVCYKINFVNG